MADRKMKILIAGIILFLPWGIYKKILFDFSYLNNELVTYWVVRFFPTDILLFLVTLSILVGFIRFRGRGVFGVEVIFFFIFGLAALFSPFNKAVSLYLVWRLFLYLGFYCGVRRFVKWKKAAWLLVPPVIFESFLAFLQFANQSFVFGFVPWGEPHFSASQSGAPLVNLLGDLKLRSFGTFPHPNVLGGFLAVVLPWLLVAGLYSIGLRRLLFLVAAGVSLVGLFLTFSQSAWGALVLGLSFCLWLLLGERGKVLRLLRVLLIVLTGMTVLTIGRLPLETPNSRRLELNDIAGDLIRINPWLGVGPGHFLYYSPPEWREPVHNLFLLIGAEAGLPALFVFVALILKHLRRAFREPSLEKKLLDISLLQLIFLGLFDHYLWTSHPGQLLFWLVLGLISGKNPPAGDRV